MTEQWDLEIVEQAGATRGHPEALRGRRAFYIGVDIGSTSSDVVVLNDAGEVLFSDYERTKGRPIQTAHKQLQKVFKRINIILNSLLAAILGASSVTEFKDTIEQDIEDMEDNA